MDNKKQTPLRVKTDHSVPRFIVAPSINEAKKWVKKDRRRLFKANAHSTRAADTLALNQLPLR